MRLKGKEISCKTLTSTHPSLRTQSTVLCSLQGPPLPWSVLPCPWSLDSQQGVTGILRTSFPFDTLSPSSYFLLSRLSTPTVSYSKRHCRGPFPPHFPTECTATPSHPSGHGSSIFSGKFPHSPQPPSYHGLGPSMDFHNLLHLPHHRSLV